MPRMKYGILLEHSTGIIWEIGECEDLKNFYTFSIIKSMENFILKKQLRISKKRKEIDYKNKGIISYKRYLKP